MTLAKSHDQIEIWKCKSKKRRIKKLGLMQEIVRTGYRNGLATYKIVQNIINDQWKTGIRCQKSMKFSTTSFCKGLDEFFDNPKNWGESKVKVGRSWKVEELRLKSNEDLHKLWYVLLKEKNMLLTMEHEHASHYVYFPNPERVDKVQDSMENLESVVRERNEAYWLLEVGETGERPVKEVTNSFGITDDVALTEHIMPEEYNPDCAPPPETLHMTKEHFLRLMREKQSRIKTLDKRLIESHIEKLFARFPDIDVDALQKEYPKFNVRKIRERPGSRGNHASNYC